MSDLYPRTWFAFAVTLPHLGEHGPMINFVPAATEEGARAKMRDTVHPKIGHLVDAWPLVEVRRCSRAELTRSFLALVDS